MEEREEGRKEGREGGKEEKEGGEGRKTRKKRRIARMGIESRWEGTRKEKVDGTAFLGWSSGGFSAHGNSNLSTQESEEGRNKNGHRRTAVQAWLKT
jgi:hypothetical protein